VGAVGRGGVLGSCATAALEALLGVMGALRVGVGALGHAPVALALIVVGTFRARVSGNAPSCEWGWGEAEEEGRGR